MLEGNPDVTVTVLNTVALKFVKLNFQLHTVQNCKYRQGHIVSLIGLTYTKMQEQLVCNLNFQYITLNTCHSPVVPW